MHILGHVVNVGQKNSLNGDDSVHDTNDDSGGDGDLVELH